MTGTVTKGAGKEGNKSKYAELERELGTRLQQFRYQELVRKVIVGYATANIRRVQKHVAVGRALGLGKKATAELEGLSSATMDLVGLLDFEMRSHWHNGVGMLQMPPNAGTHAKFEAFDRHCIDGMAGMVSGLFKKEGLEDKRNIKAAVVYPLLVAIIDTWKQSHPDFTGGLMDAVVKQEEDVRLRELIGDIWTPATPAETRNQLRRN